MQTLTESTPASSLISCHLLVQADVPLVCLLPSPVSCLLLPLSGYHSVVLGQPLSILSWGHVIWVLFFSLPHLAKSPLTPNSTVKIWKPRGQWSWNSKKGLEVMEL